MKRNHSLLRVVRQSSDIVNPSGLYHALTSSTVVTQNPHCGCWPALADTRAWPLGNTRRAADRLDTAPSAEACSELGPTRKVTRRQTSACRCCAWRPGPTLRRPYADGRKRGGRRRSSRRRSCGAGRWTRHPPRRAACPRSGNRGRPPSLWTNKQNTNELVGLVATDKRHSFVSLYVGASPRYNRNG